MKYLIVLLCLLMPVGIVSMAQNHEKAASCCLWCKKKKLTVSHADSAKKLASAATIDQPKKEISAGEMLRRAIQKDDASSALIAILQGADVNEPDAQGWSPLHHASHQASAKVVTILLAAPSINPIVTTDDGQSVAQVVAKIDATSNSVHQKNVAAILESLRLVFANKYPYYIQDNALYDIRENKPVLTAEY